MLGQGFHSCDFWVIVTPKSISMRRELLTLCLLAMGWLPVAHAQSSILWIAKAAAGDISNHVFYMENDTLAGKPDLLPLFMHNFNPYSSFGKYVKVKQGLYFSNNNWRLFNQDKSDFVEDSYYNIWVPGAKEEVFKHSSVPSNTNSNQTVIDHPSLNGNPNAIVVISSKWEGGYDTYFQGLYYRSKDKRWRIYNEGGLGELMEEGRHFHVLVADKSSSEYTSLLITANANNTAGHVLTIDNAAINGNPGAMLFATHVYNPGGAGSGVYNNHPVGVYYAQGKWKIYNEDFAPIAPGTAFNVIAFPQAPVATSIEKPLKTTAVNIFPNPAPRKGWLQVELDVEQTSPVELTVFNLIGECIYRTVLTGVTGKQMHAIELNRFDRGMYLVKVQQDNQSAVQKLVIQ